VKIPYEKGLLAHSDGDAVIHALCDALLGAAALGDIGSYFPDSSEEFENIDSRILLRQVKALIDKKNLTIVNADITILAQAPKMSPHILSMRENISQDTEVHIDNINIKATTTEKMGFIGREEGIAVHAVILLE
jgi:2-C-methyl-D-erythritol 2,4-cyclodiphosphate synthase